MSFLSDLFGGKSAQQSADAYQQSINTGYNLASPTLYRGYDDANTYLKGGYDKARNDVLSGLNTAHTALNNGSTNARKELTTGYNNARATTDKGLASILDLFQPYMQSGTKAQGMYDTALGMNGADAAKQFYGDYAANDPFRAFRDEMANKSILAQANAAGTGGVGGLAGLAGGAGGGRTAAAISRASLERGSQDMNQYLDRLSRASELGGQYATRAAGYTDAAAARNAGYDAQQGQNLGQLEQSHANTLAGLYTNNAVGSGQLAAQEGQQLANNSVGRGNAISNLDYGYNQQVGQNQAQMYNNIGQAHAAGMNGLINLGTAGAKLAMGGNQTGGFGNFLGGGSTTTPGTAANGGWQTTTTPNNWWNSIFGKN